jgi:hypothetical protein
VVAGPGAGTTWGSSADGRSSVMGLEPRLMRTRSASGPCGSIRTVPRASAGSSHSSAAPRHPANVFGILLLSACSDLLWGSGAGGALWGGARSSGSGAQSRLRRSERRHSALGARAQRSHPRRRGSWASRWAKGPKRLPQGSWAALPCGSRCSAGGSPSTSTRPPVMRGEGGGGGATSLGHADGQANRSFMAREG